MDKLLEKVYGLAVAAEERVLYNAFYKHVSDVDKEKLAAILAALKGLKEYKRLCEND